MRTKKVTVRISSELLRNAKSATGAGIAETVREGLLLLVQSDAYRQLRALRGKVQFSVDLMELRRDDR